VSVCVSSLPIVATQQLGKHVPAATNTRNRRIDWRVVFYVVRVISKESLWACLRIILSLLGNGSVNTFPRQRRIVGGVLLYAICVVSKEIRRSVLHRTSCLILKQVVQIAASVDSLEGSHSGQQSLRCGLFCNTSTIANYIAWNGRKIDKWSTGKYLEGSGASLNQVVSDIFLEGLEITTKNLPG
jgi:hypothetical protein